MRSARLRDYGSLFEAFCKPHLNDGLSCDAKLSGFPAKRFDHPCGKVNIHALLAPAENQRVQRFRKMMEAEDGNGTE
jgi:hypothetical protein